MLGSSNGQDEGPAYEYPEVIHGQGKYGDNVERHINGLKGHSVSQPSKSRPTKKGYSSTKSKHPGVYSFGKSMSTIPFSFHQTQQWERRVSPYQTAATGTITRTVYYTTLIIQ